MARVHRAAHDGLWIGVATCVLCGRGRRHEGPSAGFGVRLTYENHLSVRIDLAQVIDGAGLRPNHSDMLHASALWAF